MRLHAVEDGGQPITQRGLNAGERRCVQSRERLTAEHNRSPEAEAIELTGKRVKRLGSAKRPQRRGHMLEARNAHSLPLQTGRSRGPSRVGRTIVATPGITFLSR